MSDWTVALLVILLIAQQVFWSVTTHRLVNKLMSRNYHEYKQTEQAFQPKPPQYMEPEPQEDFGAMHGVGGF